MNHQLRTDAKTVRSTAGRIVFAPDEYRTILTNRDHGGANRLRVAFQTSSASYFSPEFSMRVGVTILVVHIEPMRIKIMGVIDNEAIQNYNFEAKLVVDAARRNEAPKAVTYGGKIQFGHNDFQLDRTLAYDWSAAKLVYFGPDDPSNCTDPIIGLLSLTCRALYAASSVPVKDATVSKQKHGSGIEH